MRRRKRSHNWKENLAFNKVCRLVTYHLVSLSQILYLIMEAPFSFGKTVTEDAFTNRVADIKRAARYSISAIGEIRLLITEGVERK